VVGDFNGWDPHHNEMHRRGDDGVWETFVAGARQGARYKYAIEGAAGGALPHKSDPLARFAEAVPGNASIVWNDPPRVWRDARWMRERASRIANTSPVSIYEVHLGSWRRNEGGRLTSYREAAAELLPYAREMGFTHVELLPLAEHPFEGSWGYQATGLFAPTSRYGTPEDLRAFVERAHELELGIIFDWVPSHFPNDPHGLALFDGTPLYEHADPQRGRAPEWNSLAYDYGRAEVADFLIASALYWLEEFHGDGLRVDAVASLLYLDYGRAPGEWTPNVRGGNENLEAIEFLRRFNETIARHRPDVATFAEESTIWPKVTAPVASGGLGFAYKWNMGWARDTLAYFAAAADERTDRWAALTQTFSYAHGERYVLPLSHDEVVHSTGSLLQKMPGDDRARFANLRVLFAFTFVYPGKKLFFMGSEFGDACEWDHDAQLDWSRLDDAMHAGVRNLVRDCNALYRRSPALHRLDADPAGFALLGDARPGVLSFARSAGPEAARIVIAINVTTEQRRGVASAASLEGPYRVAIDTNSLRYGGNGAGAAVSVSPLSLDVPPLCAVVLEATP
jgi:1,4-alpha-glucan branching enzyme